MRKKLVSALTRKVFREIRFRDNQLALEKTVHNCLKLEMEGLSKFILDDKIVVRVVMQNPTQRLFIADGRNFPVFRGH